MKMPLKWKITIHESQTLCQTYTIEWMIFMTRYLEIFVCILLISNHTVFLVQFGINLPLWVFQKAKIARAVQINFKLNSKPYDYLYLSPWAHKMFRVVFAKNLFLSFLSFVLLIFISLFYFSTILRQVLRILYGVTTPTFLNLTWIQ